MLTHRTLKRLAIGIGGFLVLVAGILLIPLPGPGLLVVIAGLSILALEFAWAKRWLDWTKDYAKRARAKMPAAPAWTKPWSDRFHRWTQKWQSPPARKASAAKPAAEKPNPVSLNTPL